MEKAKLNFIDRAINFVAPEFGMRRMAARNVLHAFDQDPDRNYRRGSSGGLAKNGSTESWMSQRDAIREMWDARDLARHDWIGGTLARAVMYILGDLKCRAQTGDPAVDSQYDGFQNEWMGDTEDDDGQYACDVTGRHSLEKMAQLGLMGMFVDGDHGTVMMDDDEDLRLQLVEGDRIGSPIEAEHIETYIRGITIADDLAPRPGQVLSYRIYHRRRDGQYVNPQEIEPARFIHLWDPARGDQYRGRSYLAPILDECRDIREWDKAEMTRGKTVSMYAAFLVSKNPLANYGATSWDGKTAAGTPTQEAKYGMMVQLGEGEDVRFAQSPDNPSGAFQAYISGKFRKIAITLDLPYEFIWDMSPLGGVNSRIVTQQAQRKFNYWQKLVIRRYLRRVRAAKLARGIRDRIIPPHPNWRQCEWGFGPFLIADAGYEMQNDVTAFRYGFQSVAGLAHKYDTDIEGNMRKNAATFVAIRDIAAESGVPGETLAPDLCAGLTQNLAAMAEPPAPPAQPGSLEAVGDKGAAQILDLLSKVTTGQMDPESAKLALVQTYQYPPALAEAIVPRPKARALDADGGGEGVPVD